jgi:integrase
MASVYIKEWSSRGPNGRRVRHAAWGYTLTAGEKQERKFSSEWATREQAWEALNARLKAIEAGQLTPREPRTLGQVAEEYLQYKTVNKKRSVDEDRRILEKRLLPAFGADRLVKDLTGHAIAQYERRRVGQVSAFTVRNELTVLRHMLRLARRWGYLEQVPDIELPKKPEDRQRYLEQEEITALLKTCAKSKNPYLHAIVTLALNTGMRKSELLGLEWERVNLSTSQLTLYRTKSGKPRSVPVNEAVYDALVGLEPDAERRTGPIFKRRDGSAWGQIRTGFTSACAKAGITNFRFHDLRHTAASHLVMRGASLQDVKEILGHSDFKMTLRYAHLSSAHLRRAVGLLDGLTPGREAPSLAHSVAHSDKLAAESSLSGSEVADSKGDAPVAQVDRAAVS